MAGAQGESFTVTPLHCGSATTGSATAETENTATRRRALARHGADDLRRGRQPEHGLPLLAGVTLLLTLFNVRLGWWLGNPGRRRRELRRAGPANAIRPFIAEMFGLTTDAAHTSISPTAGISKISALYEMVRRRCRCIVVSDAGCDPKYGFEDLGNAVRKIAIDLGIYIASASCASSRPARRTAA